MSPPEGFPPTAGSKVPLPGCKGGTVRENSGLCTDPPVLDEEVQHAYPGPIPPFWWGVSWS